MVSAQHTSMVEMEIRNESGTEGQHIMDLTVVLHNKEQVPFKGKINIRTPEGIRAAANGIKAELDPGETVFLPVKIIVSNNAVAGEKNIVFHLTDLQNNTISEKSAIFKVAENTSLRILAENPVLYINNMKDSVEVRARVSNLGNIRQNITVVFKIPEITQENIFVEKKGSVSMQKDSVFIFKFMPSGPLARTSQFSVNIAGFRDPEKEIFGNASVSVQNVASSQKYQDPQNTVLSDYSRNSITAAYRRVGENLNMYQMRGAGSFNLPSGYVSVRGNIYTLNGQGEPVVTNTYVTYRNTNNEYTIGNISKMMEMSMFGRGAEYAWNSSAKDKKLELGFVDQAFSLVERHSFLEYGYGFYARGSLMQDAARSFSATYVFRNDPYEKARHNLVGTDMQYVFNKDWNMTAKVYSGLSVYDQINITKPSMAVESRYSGIIRKINLNGNYFYSTDYYPGNRRGILQVQQNISANINKDYSVYGNILISNFSPKFYFFNNNLISDTFRVDTGISLPKIGNTGFTLGVQYQDEKSNAYNNFFTTAPNLEKKTLTAQRVTDYMTWSSHNARHSAVLGLEGGLVEYPDRKYVGFQMKTLGNYSYKWFNFNLLYQYGSYFLSEYAFSKVLNENSTYKKLSLSAFVNENFLDRRLAVASGATYTDDIFYGKSPSAFVNLKYSGKTCAVYLNTSWFYYSSRSSNNSLLTLEAGITVNLKTNTPDPGKKGNITAFVYYDRNMNGIYDADDQAAENYLVMLDKVSFRTDSKGYLQYKALPFGKYPLRQIIQKGWYYDEKEIDLNNYQYVLQIPLHQNGTLKGSISYDFNEKTAMEFDPKFGGIVFNIYRNDQLLQRMVTDDNGEFVFFLESGKYRIELNENSLPENTYVERTDSEADVTAGKILTLKPFVIKVKEKRIRVKKFGTP
ncbi:hypothetical protein CHA01nite_00680 [Chryseobacterium hagamense]|uniref:SD-repeat containing protein B domain-containing protein n=2 Tax=Chryseobacterium hagamense TaxID=395935 RepID=A0A511YGL5_9FLAO|nr:hypothetical protein CHA01nite_00680 [Chryseobacterium hagamense]